MCKHDLPGRFNLKVFVLAQPATPSSTECLLGTIHSQSTEIQHDRNNAEKCPILQMAMYKMLIIHLKSLGRYSSIRHAVILLIDCDISVIVR